MKGAVERVLPHCSCYATTNDFNGSKQLTTSPLTDDVINRLVSQATLMGTTGLRVLGLASGPQSGQLTFLGLVGIMDPPRDGIRDSVRILSAANVKVKMITGDAKETALSIGAFVSSRVHDVISLLSQRRDLVFTQRVLHRYQDVTSNRWMWANYRAPFVT